MKKQLFLALLIPISFNCFVARAFDTPIPGSIQELYKANLTTKPNLARPTLETLKQQMSRQDNIVSLANEWFVHVENEKTNEKNLDTSLREGADKVINLNGNTIYCKKSESAESLSFALRYRAILQKNVNDYSQAYRNNAQSILTQWEEQKNEDIKLMLKRLSQRIQYMHAIFQRNIIEKKLLNATKTYMQDLPNKNCKNNRIQEDLKNIYSLLPAYIPKSPLQFISAITQLVCRWKHEGTLNLDYANGDDEDHIDFIFAERLPRLYNRYQKFSPQLDHLKGNIESILLKTKPKSKKNSVLAYHQQFANNNKKNRRYTQHNKRNQKKSTTHKPQQTHVNNTKSASSSSAQAKKTDRTAKGILKLKGSSSSSSSSNNALSLNTEKAAFVPVKKNQNIISKNDAMITLKDLRLNAIIKLFKVDNPQHTFKKLKYTDWVNAWLTEPNEAFKDQGYMDISNPRYAHRKDAKLVHGFSSLVDTYLTECSTKSKIYNKKTQQIDIVITIPGSITQNNQETFGLFTYFINSKTNQCYHRNFEKRNQYRLLEDYYQKGYYDVEFPQLSSLMQ